MIRNWSKRLIKLIKDPARSLVLEKPIEKDIDIDIVNEGVIKL